VIRHTSDSACLSPHLDDQPRGARIGDRPLADSIDDEPPPKQEARRNSMNKQGPPPGSTPTGERSPIERLTYRVDDLAERLGVSRRLIEKARSAGKIPPADLKLGRVPLWRVETIQAWLANGGTTGKGC
jgi:hypothetical protein